MGDLPGTQTQEEYFQPSQEIEVRIPWGRLCAVSPTMFSVDLHEPLYTFGRSPFCTIVIEQSHFSSILNISKEHFSLHRDDDDDVVFLTDLSKNGTFINDFKVGKNKKHIIYNDDIIAFGNPATKIYTFNCNLNREDFEYPVEMKRKYFISKKLGRGGFGVVRLAHEKRTFKKFAVKQMNKARSNSSTMGHVSPPQKLKTEVEILSSFSYVFIIQMIEVFETDRDIFLVLEYMAGGELTRRIVSSLPFPEKEVKFVFYQILLAVRYLHMNGVTHRDLKPENVLLYSNGQYPLIKVTDFGLSKIMDETSMMETVCGTITYAAPEVLKNFERYDKKVDIWSLGVILFYMLSKTQPFRGEGRDEVGRNILAGKICWDAKGWKGISNSARELTKRMLTVNPEGRISVAQIFKNDWIEKDVSMRERAEQFLRDTFDATESSDEFLSAPKRQRLTTSESI